MNNDTTEHEKPDDASAIDRRRLLQAGSANLLAMGLAGCNGLLSQERTYRSSWVSLETDGRPAKITFEGDDEVEIERTFNAGGTLQVTMVNHVVGYGRRGAGFVGNAGLAALSTPLVEEGGETLNPVATQPLGELLLSDLVDPLLQRLDVDKETWRKSPQRVRKTDAKLLGIETTVETFSGVTDKDEVVLINATRVTVGGDAVIVGDIRKRSTDDGGSTVSEATIDDALDLFLPVLPLVVREREGSGTTTTTADPAEFPPGRIQMSDVPQDIRRRAVRLVEDVRGKPVTWSDTATLGGFAHPIERLDVEGVAYYELAVEPTGFVICATDDHDAPIPHYNTDQRTLGERLAERGDGELARLVWIDRLRYVAENKDGQKLAAYGNEVPKIKGLDDLVDAVGEDVRSVRYGSPPEVGDVPDGEVDDGYEPVRLESQNELDLPEEIALAPWESYQALRNGYEDTYGPLLDDLRERASEAWDTMENARAIGPERVHREPILEDQHVDAVEGPDTGDVTVERRTREVAHDVLAVEPAAAAVGEVVGVILASDEGQERLTYRVEADAAPQSGRIDRIDRDGGVAEAANIAKWTSWAGGFSIQPKYHQFPHSGCMVGCGAVAWAILFGWADRQADGGQFNSTWDPRYGLYLEGGQHSGNDAVAPKGMSDNGSQNAGVWSIIREISEYVDTFCVNATQAASFPWDMEGAKQYFHGRTHTDMQVTYHAAGKPKPKCKNETRESIRGSAQGKGQTPVIVGKGWLSHYPIAYAFRKKGWPGTDQVKVNNAWGSHNDTGADAIEWIWAQSWFSGEIYP